MLKKNPICSHVCGLFALAGLTAFPATSSATSVAPMTMQTLADHAGQVFIGEVASLRSYWAENPRRIETEVVFENVEYLKGKLQDAGSGFTLIVPGGTVGQTKMTICCAPEFKVGERRLLFLLPTYKTFPTVGVAQGAFRIASDEAGTDRIYQHGQIPVVGFDEQGFVKLGRSANPEPIRHVVESNRVRVRPRPVEAASQAMTCDDFLAHVRPILDKSRKHNLTEPAGRRVLVPKTGVPLRSSAAWQSKPGIEPAASSKANEAESRLRTNKPSAKQQLRQRPIPTEADADGGTDP